MIELWDNVKNATSSIKDFVIGFTDICKSIFDFIPVPFNTILGVALIIIVALVVTKVVRG